VAAQERLRCHDQSVAPAPREQSGERRKERTIRRSERSPPLLPAEHGQLMPQHQQFDVLGELAAPTLTSNRSTAEKAR
jgi:hypothetical protein